MSQEFELQKSSIRTSGYELDENEWDMFERLTCQYLAAFDHHDEVNVDPNDGYVLAFIAANSCRDDKIMMDMFSAVFELDVDWFDSRIDVVFDVLGVELDVRGVEYYVVEACDEFGVDSVPFVEAVKNLARRFYDQSGGHGPRGIAGAAVFAHSQIVGRNYMAPDVADVVGVSHTHIWDCLDRCGGVPFIARHGVSHFLQHRVQNFAMSYEEMTDVYEVVDDVVDEFEGLSGRTIYQYVAGITAYACKSVGVDVEVEDIADWFNCDVSSLSYVERDCVRMVEE